MIVSSPSDLLVVFTNASKVIVMMLMKLMAKMMRLFRMCPMLSLIMPMANVD